MKLNILNLFLLINIALNAADTASVNSAASSVATLPWDERINLASTVHLHAIRKIMQEKFKKQNLRQNFELTLKCTESQPKFNGAGREEQSLVKSIKATFIPTPASVDTLRFEQEQLESEASGADKLELRNWVLLTSLYNKPVFGKCYRGSMKFFNVYGLPGKTELSGSIFFSKKIKKHPENITSLPRADKIEIKCELKEGSAENADKFTYRAVNCCPHNNCCNCYCVKTTTEAHGARKKNQYFPICAPCLGITKKYCPDGGW